MWSLLQIHLRISFSIFEKMRCFRSGHSQKIGSWNISEHGQVKNANRMDNIEPQLLKRFAPILNAHLNPTYCKLFALSEIGFEEAIEEFGYKAELNNLLDGANGTSGKILKTSQDLKKLTVRWGRALLKGEMKLSDWSASMHPVIG